MDGLDALMSEFHVRHFWDSGARRKKPDFSKYGQYKEEDWDRYGASYCRSGADYSANPSEVRCEVQVCQPGR